MQPGEKVALFGDSLAQGLRVPLQGQATGSGVKFASDTQQGTRLDQWITRGPAIAQGANYALISLGTNDAVASEAHRAKAAGYAKTISASLHSMGVTPIWVLPPPMKFPTDQIKEAIRATGDATLDSADYPRYDGIHPTPAAFQQWAADIWSEVGPKLAKIDRVGRVHLDATVSIDPLLSNRLRVYRRSGLVLEAEVHPRVGAGKIGGVLAEWKARNVALGRKVSVLIEPFGVYFHAFDFPVAFDPDNKPVLTLGFGDASDPAEPPHELMVGGTRYLMTMIGWHEVTPRTLLQQAASWFEQLGGKPESYLHSCPGSMGIAREWLRMLLREKVSTEMVPGLGAKEIYGDQYAVGAAKPDAAEQAGDKPEVENPEVGDPDEQPDGGDVPGA